jgi:hypothetical protein
MKYASNYDWNDPENSPLVDAMATLRHACTRSAETAPHTKRPGSFAAIEAIRSAIDDWAERETGNREFFWGKPHKAG